MLNRIIIMGRLVRDPELRTTQSGISVTSFTLAVDRDFKNRDSGEKNTDFIDVVAWRQTAEFVCKYFSKGRMAVSRSASGRTRTATTAAARKWSPTTSTSATASGIAATATAVRPPTGLPRPPAMAEETAATALPPPSPPGSRRSTIRTGTCPSD